MKNLVFQSICFLIITTLLFQSCGGGETVSEGDATGVTDSTITIGCWGPMTGPAALWGTIIKGQDAYFKMINEEGGINGRKINFVFKDDGYDPSRTVPAVRELVQQDEVFAISGGIGTATNMAVANFLSDNQVPWISPMSGVSHWSHPAKENIFTIFPLYFDEGQIMAEMAVDQLGAKKIGIIYQNDDFGKSGLVGVKSTLQKYDLELASEIAVEVTDSDLSSHVARLKDSGAEAVFLWVLPRQAAIILGNSAVIDFQPQWFSSFVLSDNALMYDITKGAWEGVYFTFISEYMSNDADNAMIQKYRSAFNKYYPDERWGAFAFFGFVLQEVFVEALKNAGQDLTRESFLESFASIKNFTGTSGIPVSFSSQQHLGSRSLIVMKSLSANEAEKSSDFLSANADLDELEAMLHE